MATAPNGAGLQPALDYDSPLKFKGSMARAISPSDSGSRASFSSVRENDDGLAQTFTQSKISSYIEAPEDVFDESPTAELSQPTFQQPLTQPHSQLHGFLVPPDSFKGWKEIPIKGKKASRSCEDLHKLYMTWDSPVSNSPASILPDSKTKKFEDVYPAALSPLETLPSEIQSSIIDLLVVDIPPNGLTPRNIDLMALLLTSRSLHASTLTTLYRHITIPHSRIFRKFLSTINQYPALATIVRRLDFSHFNPSMMFSTASERAKTQNLTNDTLAQCLSLTPYVQEFLGQEQIEGDLGPEVLRKLLFELPQLRALDLCGCSSAPFKNSFLTVLQSPWPQTLSITRLSLHKCLSLPSSIFEALLPRMDKLTHLDVAGTRITDRALEMIPKTARLTHLNLATCKEISAEMVVKFIASHPAVSSLVYLSLAANSTYHLLLGKSDVDALLPHLPSTLRSLSLRGSRMDSSHVPQLLRLSQHLEELAVGRGLEMNDIQKIFFQDKQPLSHNLQYLDISDVDTIIGSASTLLNSTTVPLRVIEIGERAYERAAKLNKNLDRVGWTAKEFSDRYWIVRKNSNDSIRDSGARWWKMGAESWGMRKVPVAVSDVGGMYGFYMFGRRI